MAEQFVRLTLTREQLSRVADVVVYDGPDDAVTLPASINGQPVDVRVSADEDDEEPSILAQLLTGADRGERHYRAGTVEPLDAAETAYDGSTAPQVRELTARERDVLCRLLTQALHDPRFRDEQTHTFRVIRQVVDPRR